METTKPLLFPRLRPRLVSRWSYRSILMLASIVLIFLVDRGHAQLEIPCVEFHEKLDIPCNCGLNKVNATRINCDGAVFLEFPVLPFRFYIQEISQRNAGLQTLAPQLFTASDIPLKKLDFSHNRIRRLVERMFDGVEDTLTDLSFSHNLLGDGLNVLFTTEELRGLESLRFLDLSYNMLRGIDNQILDGCAQLKVR